MAKKKHLFIAGICGTFMGGIAILARELGYEVSGCDQAVYPPMSLALKAAGINYAEGFDPALLISPNNPIDLVLFANVCKRGNPLVEAVLNQSIPYTSGPEWLFDEVLSKRHVLAIAGTHGKTTSTSLLSWILTEAGLNPGYLIGGVCANFSQTASLGAGPYFVIEADEYDTAFFDKRPKFLHYRPKTLVLTNLEFDHADIYPNLAAIEQQFHYLIRSVPGEGRIILGVAEPALQHVLNKGIWTPSEGVGIQQGDWQAVCLNKAANSFEWLYQGRSLGVVNSALLGQHNVLNSLAAMAAAASLGIDPVTIIAALKSFRGVKRRLEYLGSPNGVSVYDDFAHHPTAMAKTLAALRSAVGDEKIVAVVQFGSNTLQGQGGGHATQDISAALQQADEVLMWNPALLAHVEVLREEMGPMAYSFTETDEIVHYLKKRLKSNDHVVLMSNKSFDGLAQKLVSGLAQ